MKTTLTHKHDDCLEYYHDDKMLFRYVYQPNVPTEECPKPYFHPLSSLAGDCLTNFRPNDHPWHQGLSMTLCHVSRFNFWGGPSFRPGEGYKQLPNVGRQQHDSWEKILHGDDDSLHLVENLSWIAPEQKEEKEGNIFFKETREIEIDIHESQGYWTLAFCFRFINTSKRSLRLGTYSSEEGLKGSHYTGLFFRGSRDLLAHIHHPDNSHLGIIGPNDLRGIEDLHGTSTPWLAFVGNHDTSLRESTILFIDQPDNVNYPNKWFIREPLPAASFPFVSTEGLDLEPDAELTLRYRIVIANGAWSREKIQSFL